MRFGPFRPQGCERRVSGNFLLHPKGWGFFGGGSEGHCELQWSLGTETGAYLQPDTPDQVLENLRNAIAELNAPNYRRSFSDGFRFQPTAEAEAQDPSIWNGWGAQEEESYFRALVEAARLTSGNELRLTDIEQTAGSVRYTVEASYVLVLNHRSTELPNTLQGRVAWSIEKGQDGLWYIATWTDNSIGAAASWSDLKAAFIK